VLHAATRRHTYWCLSASGQQVPWSWDACGRGPGVSVRAGETIRREGHATTSPLRSRRRAERDASRWTSPTSETSSSEVPAPATARLRNHGVTSGQWSTNDERRRNTFEYPNKMANRRRLEGETSCKWATRETFMHDWRKTFRKINWLITKNEVSWKRSWRKKYILTDVERRI